MIDIQYQIKLYWLFVKIINISDIIFYIIQQHPKRIIIIIVFLTHLSLTLCFSSATSAITIKCKM